ncbi:MAG: hypothetical protein H6704_29850 [Myxococcales bacterium]|nr:hypothetical protein [Myxococcales bacterium]
MTAHLPPEEDALSDAGDLLLRAVARRLADGRRVMLVGDAFETLQLLAEADVKELVVFSAAADADAPTGETATGAPFRMRPDWRERPNSKDLVVDPAGVAPPDEVARVLKKHGLYLSRGGAAHRALPHRLVVNARVAEAAVLGAGDAAPLWMGEADAEGPTVHLAGQVEFEAPGVVALFAPSTLGTRSAALDGALEDARTALAEQTEALEIARARATAAEAERDALRASLRAAEAAATDAEAGRATDAKALAAAQAELAELTADYEAVRAELAERRVDDRRYGALTERFEAARAEMTAEVERLRGQLQASGAHVEDMAELLAERDAARAARDAAIARLEGLVGRLAEGFDAPSPPAAAGADALEAWLQAATTAADAALARRDLRAAELTRQADELGATRARARELAAALEVLKSEAVAAPPPPARRRRRPTSTRASPGSRRRWRPSARAAGRGARRRGPRARRRRDRAAPARRADRHAARRPPRGRRGPAGPRGRRGRDGARRRRGQPARRAGAGSRADAARSAPHAGPAGRGPRGRRGRARAGRPPAAPRRREPASAARRARTRPARRALSPPVQAARRPAGPPR